ncbi:MAG: ABC transporter permease [Anaerolineaceae bacterium]|nr:ABC transporter permease [Anaerolineaceae bacterium]
MLQQTLILPALALVLALLISAVLLMITGYDPLTSYSSMWEGVFGSVRVFTEVLLKSTPLILVGTGIAVAFRCGVWNIGGEGQFYAGAVLATWVGVHLSGLPPVLTIAAVFAAGVLGGGFWAVIPGWLKVKLKVNEVVSTIMLNYIMIGLTSFLVTGPMQEAKKLFPQTDEIVQAARLPNILPPTRLNIGFLVAVVTAIIIAIILFRTPLGYAIRTVGQNPETARYAGMKVNQSIIIAMLLSGGAAGLAGAIEVSGLTWRMFATISPGYGFDGIAVALLASNNPLGTILSGFLFGALRASSELMQMNAKIPSVLFKVIQGLTIAFVIAFSLLSRKTADEREAEKSEALTASEI